MPSIGPTDLTFPRPECDTKCWRSSWNCFLCFGDRPPRSTTLGSTTSFPDVPPCRRWSDAHLPETWVSRRPGVDPAARCGGTTRAEPSRGPPMRILVTGSGGILGRAVQAALSADGHELVLLDQRREGGRPSESGT